MATSDYSKDIFKQVQDLMVMCDNLSRQVKTIKKETETTYKKEIKELKRQHKIQVDKLNKEIKDLKQENTKLKSDIDRLKKQINNNSDNSSNPPSSDIKPNKKNIPNNRTRSGKSVGGQVGHKGYHLSKQYVQDNIKNNNFIHEVKHMGNISDNYVSKYVLDISVNVKAIEYRFYADENGKITVPKQFQTDVQYGPELKTMCSVLSTEGIVAFKRLADFVSCISHGKIHVSDSSVVNFLKTLNDKSSYVIGNIKEKILNSTLMRTDATTARCENKNMSVRNYSTDECVLFCPTEGKSKKYIEETSILNNYTGTLVHDHETSMYSYGTKHVECNVHVARYLKGNTENTNNTWSSSLRSFLCCLNEHRKTLIQNGSTSFSKEQLVKYSKRYDKLIELGFDQNSKLKSKYYKDEELKLLRRLKKYKENHLMFLYDFAIPFENNMSERDLRHIKVKQKVSGHFNTKEGLDIYCNIKSIICTLKRKGQDFYTVISNIYQNIPVSI